MGIFGGGILKNPAESPGEGKLIKPNESERGIFLKVCQAIVEGIQIAAVTGEKAKGQGNGLMQGTGVRTGPAVNGVSHGQGSP